MAANPLIAQGALNRLRGSVVIPDFPELNVTAPYLAKEGIRLALQGDSVVYLPTMTGAVTSPEPYMMINMTMNLLKTQSLSDSYKKKLESSSLLGNITLRPDTITLSPFDFINCAIQNPGDLPMNGETALFPVVIGGYWLINSDLFNL